MSEMQVESEANSEIDTVRNYIHSAGKGKPMVRKLLISKLKVKKLPNF
jgi:hypothetical protein